MNKSEISISYELRRTIGTEMDRDLKQNRSWANIFHSVINLSKSTLNYDSDIIKLHWRY